MTLFPSLLRSQNLCILLARYPECLLSRASSRKAGVRHPRPRSPPAPVCVCVCVCDLYYFRGLMAFNVLAALATGGLGVSGLEPA